MAKAIDPVCGMEVDDEQTLDKSKFSGQTYFFCSSECREEFDAAPEDYVGGEDEGMMTGT
jgi:YHS domain-containing protein